MAYILGFTCADGNVYKRTLSWDLSNKFESNLDLLERFNKSLSSNYPIKSHSLSYRLKISNPDISIDIQKRGIIPNKKKVLLFPDIPKKYLRHFIRGFLDGDGWVSIRVRKERYNEVCVGFSNGSENFMKGLIESFKSELGIKNFNLRCREKKTKKGLMSKTYQLDFYSGSARAILSFLYGNLSENDLFLSRKYLKYLEVVKIFAFSEKIKYFGRRGLEIEDVQGNNVKQTLLRFLLEDNLIPREISIKFGVSLSTIYRWLDKGGIRLLEKRGSEEWTRRVITSRKAAKNAR